MKHPLIRFLAILVIDAITTVARYLQDRLTQDAPRSSCAA